MRHSREPMFDVIQYWRDIEMFEPQRIPKPNRKLYVYDLDKGKPLPWQGDEPKGRRRLKKGERWQYTVYCGVFSLDSTFEVLKRYCGEDTESYDARGRGEAALAGFELDRDGRLLPESAELSSSAWGLGKVHRLQGIHPGWSSGFSTAQQIFSTLFDIIFERRKRRDEISRELLKRLSELLLGINGTEVLSSIKDKLSELCDVPIDEDKEQSDTQTPPFDHALLDELRSLLLTLTGTAGVLPQKYPAIRIACRVVRVRHPEDEQIPRSDFLNSFIADDLTAIGRQVKSGELSGALQTYLREATGVGRVDVQQDLNSVYESTRPRNIPLGRWPAPPQYSLALGQQLAVNNAINSASSQGDITGVNGPPGTGKTTMLRDLFAALITERAHNLAKLTRPEHGFTVEHTFKQDDLTHRVPQLRPDLTGYEITVASSNNGAVQNVTAETPHANEIDERWRKRIDYFSDIGQSVLNTTRLNQSEEEWEPAWSLLAAVLGNSENRRVFSSAFWFGLNPNHVRSTARPGMLEHLKKCQPERSWAEARKQFTAAESKVTSMIAERERYYQQWVERKERIAGIEALRREVDNRRHIWHQKQSVVDAYQRDRVAAADEVERTRRVRDEWNRQRPKFWPALLRGGGEIRSWRRRAQEYVVDANAAWDQLMLVEPQGKSAIQAAQDAQAAVTTAEAEHQHAQEALHELDDAISVAKKRFGRAYPHEGTDRRTRELTAPWCDDELNIARSELFLEALRLHRSFIEHNQRRFIAGLSVAIDVVRGRVPSRLAHETRLAAWQLLFMAVPIVSTTFASVARQFTGLRQADLGWLFIDEAGQATPQAAVGAIWRTRHTVAVGDPLQLEPVLSLPHTIQQSLRKHHHLSEYWIPGWTSVQGLVDAHTQFGTYLPGAEEKQLWVGSPLTVHRRCDEPMFSVSNQIAYGELMINDTPDRKDLVLPSSGATVTKSMWLEAPAEGNHGHWIPTEGDRLDRLLTHLRDNGFDMGEVMVITPFVEVATELRKRKRFGIHDVGTVHTAQGKQADIVILVLGGDPAKPRAGSFAAEKPNFVNVATSRAKRRLFVIGNHHIWSRLPNFAELASALGDPR